MTTAAWPFLIGRATTAGHRVVVAPGFMADNPGDVDALGWLARGGDTDKAEAILVEMPDFSGGPLTALFRVFHAHERDYFGTSSDLLLDSAGRPIRLTEGIAVRLTGAEVARLRLTTTDLNTAHQILTPFFRDFWHHDGQYPMQYSEPFVAGDANDGTPLTLRALTPRRPARPRPRAARSPAAYRVSAVSSSPRQPAMRSPSSLLAIAAACVTFILALGIFRLTASVPMPRTGQDTQPSHSSAQATAPNSVELAGASQVLTELCSDLLSGNSDSAYALTTPAFRAALGDAEFYGELLGGYNKAASCKAGAFTVESVNAGTAALTIDTKAGIMQTWMVGLTLADEQWLINQLIRENLGGDKISGL